MGGVVTGPLNLRPVAKVLGEAVCLAGKGPTATVWAKRVPSRPAFEVVRQDVKVAPRVLKDSGVFIQFGEDWRV